MKSVIGDYIITINSNNIELALNSGTAFRCLWCGQIFPKKRRRHVRVCHNCFYYRKECKELIAISKSNTRCLTCNEKFIPTPSLLKKDAWNKKYCSKDCYKLSKEGTVVKECQRCGKPTPLEEKHAHYTTVFCSDYCRTLALREQTCENCGKQFSYRIFVPFCQDCYDMEFVTKCQNCGKPVKKNRKYIVNIKNYDMLENIGFGKKRLNHRFIKSEMIYCSTKCAIEQERPYYYEGIGDEVYPVEFNESLKEKIKKRDSFQCQLCGAKWGLVEHHIDYNKENNKPINLITLCMSCHSKTNFKRKWWVKLFSKYVIEWFGETI